MVNIGILALQGDVAEHVRALEESGARAVLVRRSEELASVDGLVIPGGESTTMSNLLLSFGIFDQLAEQISNGMPVYGTCAGMIMLATSILDGRDDQRSFGAIDMVVRRNAFGRQVDSYEEELDIKGIEESLSPPSLLGRLGLSRWVSLLTCSRAPEILPMDQLLLSVVVRHSQPPSTRRSARTGASTNSLHGWFSGNLNHASFGN